MAETSQGDGIKKASPAGSDDRIGALPDALLQQVLSLLPSRDAVRTCVLAARWCTLWKSVPSLRIGAAGERYGSAHALSKFVSHLLLLRDRTPLLECEINSHDWYPDGDTDEAFRYIELLLRYALSCQVRVLRVDVKEGRRLCLSDVSLLSDCLTSLEVSFVEVVGRFLDFSSCPALKVLKLKHCAIDADRISSQSLTNLIIHDVTFCSNGRTRISAPSLITLQLDSFTCHTPLLEPMPSLVRAFLRFEENCDDYCENDNYFGDCGSESCDGCSYSKFYDKDDCVLLKGLSGTVNLELISPSYLFIGRMDFKWCVMFSQLKTLLLSDWCVAANFSGLIYFVQHSPILERLTLQLECYEEEITIKKEESYNPRSQFLVSEHLKVVEINCRKEDETIHHIVKILGTHGVPPECINIKSNFRGLVRFSFE
ncbi:F-box/LRR-repeat protein At3g26922-like [Lolium rigidum]|uniref:F-box/LRR-repeat protein At3g26922-like n=1 Tax=Lolium rigidum TaxID=89674 RepID=UPI001F5CBEAB|nr:F-box/LRR-repeat protein At3g26922-like [Lolium rigidum]